MTTGKDAIDQQGIVTKFPMDDYVEVGIYANSPEGDLGDLYLEKHKLRSGEQTIKLAVSKELDLAGIDLLRFLIEFFHVTFLRKAFSS